jgi:hypothetical protein
MNLIYCPIGSGGMFGGLWGLAVDYLRPLNSSKHIKCCKNNFIKTLQFEDL